MSAGWDKTLWQTHLLSSGLDQGVIKTGLAFSVKADHSGNVTAFMAEVAEIARCAGSTAQAHREQLQAEGYLMCAGWQGVSRYGGRSRTYVLLIPEDQP